MYVPVYIASTSPDIIHGILILIIAAIIIAGPLVYKILSGEKFGWFSDPRFKRPNKKEWDELRRKADRIIKGEMEIDANELHELVVAMQVEVEGHKRHKGTIEYENDRERIVKLSQKLQGMELRVEPFDSLVEHLKQDGLVEQANKLHNVIHANSNKSFPQIKGEYLAELTKIKKENWTVLGPETQKTLRQSIKLLKQNPNRLIYISVVVFVIGLGLGLYNSIVKNRGYEFYKKNPIWTAVLAVIIGVPAAILVIKFLIWKYGMKENPYQPNLMEER